MAPGPAAEVLAQAGRVLRLNGVRILTIDGALTIGIWSDLDGPHLRAALRVFHPNPDEMPPLRYLDGPGIPMRYKARVPLGQPVPLEVVAAMQAVIAERPWEVREVMLKAIGWIPKRRVLV